MLSFLSRFRKRPAPITSPPWFEEEDALDQIDQKRARGEISDAECELLRKWATDGYVVLDNLVPEADIDGMNAFLESTITASKPIPRLSYLGVKLEPDSPPIAISHEELLKRFTPEQRVEMLARSNWRIHGFHEFDANTRRIFRSPAIRAQCSLIMGRPAKQFASINFMYGSAQKLHQDIGVFHIIPRNYLIGVWIACEDISPDCGPLEYYPGSHRSGWYEGFDNYPQTNLRTAAPEHQAGYHRFVAEEALKYERRTFCAKKGQILLWHGQLIHGGAEVLKPTTTRKSLVIHYVTEGVEKSSEVVGPFNW
ncbi:phytanoyl-CoA dioxygenase family protein [Blastopirellula sp. JC732]|uniref:Phytanoyl-CoA dioxygenase family protein n=1 Tax=Blastopirellula sediminis TaxID=2894196 RepID=A0A9X1SHE7_9BACT|nr:phytanoyl-CoA dioxygenase family protein [Blastopirellula sediminis]MCC9606389.1 phytanoyl-CoA dioxygenase family protein [Blastopirellula sediminis]MCC9630313.1 phytanoyl-CoA dioxygenase family protein [Blastopirellula sediminis]